MGGRVRHVGLEKCIYFIAFLEKRGERGGGCEKIEKCEKRGGGVFWRIKREFDNPCFCPPLARLVI